MLEKIKEAVFKTYKKTDNLWLFISAFNDKNELLVSSGVISSDKELEQLIDTLYHGLIEKHKDITAAVIDVVTETAEVSDPKEIQNISLEEYGLLLITENKSWILLPNTEWVTDISTALKVIKEKNWLEWNAKITKFKTDRFAV